MSYFVEPLLEQWDRQKLEITLYSCGEQFDDYSARLQTKTDRWVNLHGHNDEHCINQILQDEIDILIDLAGHTAGNRLSFRRESCTHPGHVPRVLRHDGPRSSGLLGH